MLVTTLLLVIAASALPGTPPDRRLGIQEPDLRLHIERADEGRIVLLDHEHIVNNPNWRREFDGQVFGFGIRTDEIHICPEDVAQLKEMLLTESSYRDLRGWGGKKCVYGGDAAILLRGPSAEVRVMFELWCARIHVRDETLLGSFARCDVDPINDRLIEMVRSYFPQDPYWAKLGK